MMKFAWGAVGRTLTVVMLLGVTSTVLAGLMDSDENRTDPGPPRNFAPPGTNSHVVMIGSGNPLPNPHRFGPATAIIVDGEPYIVDAGEGIWRGLAQAAAVHGGKIAAAFEPNKLTRLFITHQHSDHTVGIPSFLMMPWYMGRTRAVQLYGPAGMKGIVDSIMAAWRVDVDERLATKVGPQSPVGWNAIVQDFDVPKSTTVYTDERVKVEAFNHYHVELKNNFAYRFTTAERIIVIGGDGRADDRLIDAARNADVFVMEVATEADLVNAPWGGSSLEQKQRVMWDYHIKPRELADIARKAKVKLLVLYHVQNYANPHDGDALLKEVRQFYDGPVVLGRDGDIY